MASIRSRSGGFEVRARLAGKTYSKTFKTEAEASRWGTGIELGFIEPPAKPEVAARYETFWQFAERYGREVTPLKKGAVQELQRIKQLETYEWAHKPIEEVFPADIKHLRDWLLRRGRSGSTVRLMMALVSVIFKHARHEWEVDVANPVGEVRMPRASAPRYRRLNPDEEQRLEETLTRCKNPTMAAVVRFALQTGMRRSEIARLEWQDIDFGKRLVTLRTSKNGQPRWIPLNPKALEQLQSQHRSNQPRPFDVTALAISQAWRHIVRRAQLKDFRFHDLRHEALSRWAHRLKGDVFKLSLISGHRTLEMARRYVHPVESELLADL